MKNLSVKWKLIFLSGSLLGLSLVLNTIETRGISKLSDFNHNFTEVQLPAIRNMTLADMMHDSLRASVYEALYLSTLSEAQETKNEAAQASAETVKNLKVYVAALEKLDLSPQVREAITKARPAIDAYAASGESLVAMALAGKKSEAERLIPNFQKAFVGLEAELSSLGDLIEKGVEDQTSHADAETQFIHYLGWGALAIGTLLGILFSTLVIRNISTVFSAIISQLRDSSQRVAGASGESATSASRLSEAATEQAASLQETMASAEEISAMVNQNAESAEKVKAAVDLNQQASREGSASVSSMLGAIQEIKVTNDQILNQMETSNKEFGEIVKIISEIGEKTKVINDIVFQTKLLSFNASVEAARAGEHGKGFAVVAEEVGNLAQMSGNAAKQITDMLSNSIKKVNDIVQVTTHRVDELVEVGKDKITMGQSTAEKCRQALEKVTENAQSISTMIGEITSASREQAQGIQEINKAIAQLDQVTQQNTALSQESSSQADQLKRESQDLNGAVNTLTLFIHGKEELGSANSSLVPMAKKSSLQLKKTHFKKAA